MVGVQAGKQGGVGWGGAAKVRWKKRGPWRFQSSMRLDTWFSGSV